MQLEPGGEHDPGMMGGKIPKEAEGYHVLLSSNIIPLLKDEQVLARQSWVGHFRQRVGMSKGLEARTEEGAMCTGNADRVLRQDLKGQDGNDREGCMYLLLRSLDSMKEPMGSH